MIPHLHTCRLRFYVCAEKSCLQSSRDTKPKICRILSMWKSEYFPTDNRACGSPSSDNILRYANNKSLNLSIFYTNYLYREETKRTCNYPGCGSAFVQRADRDRHFACVHEKNNKYPGKFKKCTRKNRDRHFACVHGKDKKFPCKFKNCSRKIEYLFNRKDHLLEHLRDYHSQHIKKRRRREVVGEEEEVLSSGSRRESSQKDDHDSAMISLFLSLLLFLARHWYSSCLFTFSIFIRVSEAQLRCWA